jgi:hypothetical protein
MLPCLSKQSPPGYAPFEIFRLAGLKLLQLVRSLRVRRAITSACKVCSRASGSFKERFGRMGLLAGSASVSCMMLRTPAVWSLES